MALFVCDSVIHTQGMRCKKNVFFFFWIVYIVYISDRNILFDTEPIHFNNWYALVIIHLTMYINIDKSVCIYNGLVTYMICLLNITSTLFTLVSTKNANES